MHFGKLLWPASSIDDYRTKAVAFCIHLHIGTNRTAVGKISFEADLTDPVRGIAAVADQSERLIQKIESVGQ